MHVAAGHTLPRANTDACVPGANHQRLQSVAGSALYWSTQHATLYRTLCGSCVWQASDHGGTASAVPHDSLSCCVFGCLVVAPTPNSSNWVRGRACTQPQPAPLIHVPVEARFPSTTHHATIATSSCRVAIAAPLRPEFFTARVSCARRSATTTLPRPSQQADNSTPPIEYDRLRRRLATRFKHNQSTTVRAATGKHNASSEQQARTQAQARMRTQGPVQQAGSRRPAGRPRRRSTPRRRRRRRGCWVCRW